MESNSVPFSVKSYIIAIITGMNLENQIERAVVRWDSVQWYPLAGHRALTKIAVIGNIYENAEYI